MSPQGYNSHKDEDDPERIQTIIHRSLADADWILDKVRSSLSFTLKKTCWVFGKVSCFLCFFSTVYKEEVSYSNWKSVLELFCKIPDVLL